MIRHPKPDGSKPALSDEDRAALVCLSCPHLKVGAGQLQCLRKTCRLKSQRRRFEEIGEGAQR